jgi:hypothetical protein
LRLDNAENEPYRFDRFTASIEGTDNPVSPKSSVPDSKAF